MAYNPFDVLAGEPLTPEELQKLVSRSVAEGYFVEYKSMPPTNEKMGRSIASFANTYGGWYIVGVTTNGHNVATAVPGFDRALCPDPIARIREVIKTHISPSPVFYAQVVTLESGNLILVVHVPEGQDSPFITRDGRIYRRHHDSSDPVPEADRHAIDRLVEQGRQGPEEFARFCRDERNFSKAEDKRRWVGIYIQPYPTGIVDRRRKMRSQSALDEAIALSKCARDIHLLDFAHEGVQDVEATAGADSAGQDTAEVRDTATVTATGNIPFTSGMLTPRSIVLRQVEHSRVGINSNISVELLFDGSAKIHFELPEINPLSNMGDAGDIKHKRVRETLGGWTIKD